MFDGFGVTYSQLSLTLEVLEYCPLLSVKRNCVFIVVMFPRSIGKLLRCNIPSTHDYMF